MSNLKANPNPDFSSNEKPIIYEKKSKEAQEAMLIAQKAQNLLDKIEKQSEEIGRLRNQLQYVATVQNTDISLHLPKIGEKRRNSLEIQLNVLFKNVKFMSKIDKMFKTGEQARWVSTFKSTDYYVVSEPSCNHGQLSAFGNFLSSKMYDLFNVNFNGEYPEELKNIVIILTQYYVDDREIKRLY